MVFMQDMIIKRQKATAKLKAALAKARPALMIGNILSEDPRLVGAALKAGVTLFENNHPSLALKMGINGVTTMGMAEEIRYKVPLSAT